MMSIQQQHFSNETTFKSISVNIKNKFLFPHIHVLFSAANDNDGKYPILTLKDEWQDHALRACIIVFIREVYNK